jgi:hypothetical protein
MKHSLSPEDVGAGLFLGPTLLARWTNSRQSPTRGSHGFAGPQLLRRLIRKSSMCIATAASAVVESWSDDGWRSTRPNLPRRRTCSRFS